MKTLLEIESLTKKYSEAREQLTEKVKELESKLEIVKGLHMPSIKSTLIKTREGEAKLRDAIEESPGLFEKPKTLIFHGIKIGYQKGKGKIEWDDTDTVLKLIKKHFPEQADILIRLKEEINKRALGELAVADLKRLGVTVVEAGDEILIKTADGEVDKIVRKLLEEKKEEERQAA